MTLDINFFILFFVFVPFVCKELRRMILYQINNNLKKENNFGLPVQIFRDEPSMILKKKKKKKKIRKRKPTTLFPFLTNQMIRTTPNDSRMEIISVKNRKMKGRGGGGFALRDKKENKQNNQHHLHLQTQTTNWKKNDFWDFEEVFIFVKGGVWG